MKPTQRTYDLYFRGFIFSIIIVFCWVRPLQSPWHRFIAADGLGYYAYLPAQFIYHDTQLDFKWFNAAYKSNYPPGTFENPEDNFLVKYKDKRVNKYYQGLSFIWMPFFLTAHVLAKLFHYPPDGFSAPYQLMMGLASLFYLVLGLHLLRKLLLKLFDDAFAATLVPVLIFYATYLFNYAVNYNTLSHVYSFSLLIAFVYFSYLFLNESDNRAINLLFAILCYTLTVCVRPFNAFTILLPLAFMPSGFFKSRPRFEKLKSAHILLILLIVAAIAYQLRLVYIQTGALWSNTYYGERFDFGHSRFFQSLFSYHLGLFVYAPVMLLAFAGTPFLAGRKKFLLPLFFLALSFVYSSWWYWPIVKRALIDYYVIPAILLAALLGRVRQKRFHYALMVLLILCAAYYQFKEMQIRRGILDEFLTYKEVFWRNFFRTSKANMYLVPPATIIEKSEYTQDFEDPREFPRLSREHCHSGISSLEIGPENSVVVIASHPFPSIFGAAYRRKIRLSFWSYFEKGMGQVHVFMRFVGRDGKTLLEEPFYLNGESIITDKWDYKEMGYEVSDTGLLNGATVARIDFIVWNTEGLKRLWLDGAKVEFLLCNEDFETTK